MRWTRTASGNQRCPLQRVTSRRSVPHRSLSVFVLLAVLCAACGSESAYVGTVSAKTEQLVAALGCSGNFVPHDLEHETRGPGAGQTMFDGTGSGVAVADLDRDGLDDIVLPSLLGETSVLWNEGDLVFRREALIKGRFRQVSIVDIDGDTHRDIVLTTGVGRPVVFIGDGLSTVDGFDRIELAGFDMLAYSLAWGDIGGDGDIDAVGASYNAELTSLRRLNLGDKDGTIVFENTEDGYQIERLAEDGQSLVVLLTDLNDDGRADIYVGNDLATPDRIWHGLDAGWTEVAPFSTTTFSTMSVDVGDVDNDGDMDVFATDMHPMSNDAATRDSYIEVERDMAAAPRVDDVQQPQNVLQVAGGDGYIETATELGVHATGWSWSGLFGDLDNDGWQDIYVANGMVADVLFSHLPNNTLVEPNQAFRNIEGSQMVPAPEWGLADTAGGRGMAMADFDRDGDLDIVVNNVNDPARIHENQLCDVGDAVEVSLEWTATANIDAIGSKVTLITADGTRLSRSIDVSRGYLSGGPPTAFFGVGHAPGPFQVEVRWPDGWVSRAAHVEPGSAVELRRDSGTLSP